MVAGLGAASAVVRTAVVSTVASKVGRQVTGRMEALQVVLVEVALPAADRADPWEATNTLEGRWAAGTVVRTVDVRVATSVTVPTAEAPMAAHSTG